MTAPEMPNNERAKIGMVYCIAVLKVKPASKPQIISIRHMCLEQMENMLESVLVSKVPG